jgi:hypothetical protein
MATEPPRRQPTTAYTRRLQTYVPDDVDDLLRIYCAVVHKKKAEIVTVALKRLLQSRDCVAALVLHPREVPA